MKCPNNSGNIRRIHNQLPRRGPFKSTEGVLLSYKDEDVPLIHQINPFSKLLFTYGLGFFKHRVTSEYGRGGRGN